MKGEPVAPKPLNAPPFKDTAYVKGATPPEMVPVITASGDAVQSKSLVKCEGD